MESTAILCSFNGAILKNQQCFRENSVAAPVYRHQFRIASGSQGLAGRGLVSSSVSHRRHFRPYLRTSGIQSALTSDEIISEMTSEGTLENKHVRKSTFPNGFEDLVLNVCDETDIAEVKLKVGDFEMHLKRDIGIPKAPISTATAIESPRIAPPVPSEPMFGSSPAAQPVMAQKSSAAPSNLFANDISSTSLKLAALEASGSKSFVVVRSPTVGTFQSGRTLKGKKQPPSCKEGDMIKAGQPIGYVDQFGSELPVRSDVAGEVLKIIFRDGEAVGYGDPLVAILPSFHGIQ